jgi:hypothetical protein
MCIICVELIKQKMSLPEARRNLREIIEASSDDFIHQYELWRAIDEDNFDKLSEILINEDGNSNGNGD